MRSKKWCRELLSLIDYVEKHNEIPYHYSYLSRKALHTLRIVSCIPCFLCSLLGNPTSEACILAPYDAINRRYSLPDMPFPDSEKDTQMMLDALGKLKESLEKNSILKSYLLIQSTMASIQKYAYRDLQEVHFNPTTIFRSKDVLDIAFYKLQRQSKYIY